MSAVSATAARRVTSVALQARRGRGHDAEGPSPALPVVGRGNRWVEFLDAFGVASLIAPHAHELVLDASVTRTLLTMREHSVRAALRSASDTAVVSRLLDAAGIDHLMIGGVALGGLVGTTTGARTDGPIRVWVRATERSVAEAVVTSAGWWQSGECPGRFAHRSRCAVEIVTKLGHERRLRQLAFGRSFASSVPLPHIAPWARAAPAASAIVAASDGCRRMGWDWIRSVADVVELIPVCPPDDLAGLQRNSRSVRHAVAAAVELAPWLAESVRVSRWDRLRARRSWAAWTSLPAPVVSRRSASPRQVSVSRAVPVVTPPTDARS